MCETHMLNNHNEVILNANFLNNNQFLGISNISTYQC